MNCRGADDEGDGGFVWHGSALAVTKVSADAAVWDESFCLWWLLVRVNMRRIVDLMSIAERR